MKNETEKQNDKEKPNPERSVCGCPFACLDWNTHFQLHGISQRRADVSRSILSDRNFDLMGL